MQNLKIIRFEKSQEPKGKLMGSMLQNTREHYNSLKVEKFVRSIRR